jgi:hypothetical protein
MATAAALAAALFSSLPVAAASYRTEIVNIRGKSQSLAVYEPAPGSVGRAVQVIVTSGDVGWIGLPVDIAEHLQKAGYRTIGFNARAYLSSFTGKEMSLKENDIPGDYRTLVDWLISQRAGPLEFVMVGTSEGAGLSVVGMSQPASTRGCRGIIALGLPGRTSLGWRWTDFPMWITKKDPKEPQAETGAYLSRLRLPLVMIHSTHDEWDSIDKAREMYLLHAGPKKFIAIDAVNHRFSNKISEALNQIDDSLKWLQRSAGD